MKKVMITAFGILFTGLGLLYAKVRLDSDSGNSSDVDIEIITGEASHTATTEMIATADEMANQAAPSFRAAASDGGKYSIADLAAEGPLALLFIKDGCPCSVAAEPFIDQLFDAYGKRVRFFGVIDGGVDVAKRWAKENHVPFPILSDPDLELVRKFKAENSAYFSLISQGGTIDKCWPGYSSGMLIEASQRLAHLAGIGVATIDVTEAPEILYSGCPYESQRSLQTLSKQEMSVIP